MRQAGIAIESDAENTNLGTGFWVGWGAGMAATLGAFAAAMYAFTQSGSPGGPYVGGGIVIAFTLALIGVASLPGRVRRQRGFGERMRPAYRRYAWRFMPAMFAYVILVIAAASYARSAEPTGPLAWLVALAPAIPLLFGIRAIFLLPHEEDDEYQRDRINRSYAWATGATLMVCTVAGFLDMFDVVQDLELWIVFPMWSIFMGLARCFPLGGAK